jgi:DNA-binding response OmpR family regulator
MSKALQTEVMRCSTFPFDQAQHKSSSSTTSRTSGEILSAVLSRQGFEVRLAPEGLDELSTQSIDLVILGIMMPGASGIEILSKIRSEPERAKTPISILTAKGQHADREAAIAGGSNDFITKPFRPKKLIAQI